ncbi:MAG: hypothetical protein J0M15_16290 [Deltaproteobacteria bacterium]|jgi:hypothetical protein|nr:hypothetical protein [Deltaproteobacteria bacterium]
MKSQSLRSNTVSFFRFSIAIVAAFLVFFGCSPKNSDPVTEQAPLSPEGTSAQIESEGYIEIQGLNQNYYLRSMYFDQSTKVQYQILNSQMEPVFQKAFNLADAKNIKEISPISISKAKNEEWRKLSWTLDTQFSNYKSKLQDRFKSETQSCISSEVIKHYRSFSLSKRGPAWLILRELSSNEVLQYLALQIDFETESLASIGIIKGNWDLSLDNPYVSALAENVVFGEPSTLNHISEEIFAACQSQISEIKISSGPSMNTDTADALASRQLDLLFNGSGWGQPFRAGVAHVLMSEGPFYGIDSLKRNTSLLKKNE